MPKKRATVSLRKPSPAPDAPVVGGELESERTIPDTSLRDTLVPPSESRTVEAFVNGAATALEQAASEIPSAKLHELVGRGPAGYRELTVYLPEALARELSAHCLRRGLDLSRVVAAAIAEHLHGASSREGRVAALARLLVGDLAQWLRSAWARRRGAAPSGADADATA
jgi:hypothetical protein